MKHPYQQQIDTAVVDYRGVISPPADVATATPVTVDISHRLISLAQDAHSMKERLASLFGEGEGGAKEAHPTPAGAFGSIHAALCDLEMFMRRIGHYVDRI